MKLLLIGHSGTIGSAVQAAAEQRGYEIVTAAKSGGDITVDITQPESVQAMYEAAGRVDAVVVAVGHAPFRPLPELTADDFTAGWHGKALAQINIVQSGLGYMNDGGSFTLTTGILATTPVPGSAAAAAANGAIEAFVRIAPAELPRGIRLNAISPTVVTESLEKFGAVFPGFKPVPVGDVAQCYIRSIEGLETGKIYTVGH